MLIAVFQHGVQKAFRLTGTGSCRYQCGAGIIAVQPIKRLILMNIRCVVGVYRVKPLVAMFCHAERQFHRNIRLMEESVFLFQKTPNTPFKDRRCDREGRLHIVSQAFAELGSQYRRYHILFPLSFVWNRQLWVSRLNMLPASSACFSLKQLLNFQFIGNSLASLCDIEYLSI